MAKCMCYQGVKNEKHLKIPHGPCGHLPPESAPVAKWCRNLGMRHSEPKPAVEIVFSRDAVKREHVVVEGDICLRLLEI